MGRKRREKRGREERTGQGRTELCVLYTAVILALQRLRHEGRKFAASQLYIESLSLLPTLNKNGHIKISLSPLGFLNLATGILQIIALLGQGHSVLFNSLASALPSTH